MESSLGPLLPLFQRERAAGRALALGVLIRTQGSTYRKPGALILIAGSGEYAGLISGGCLEGDLREHARAVIDTGEARIVNYDMRGSEDLLWGLGLGCEGAMQILLLRAGPENGWQPLDHFASAMQTFSMTAVGIVAEAGPGGPRVGTIILPTSVAAAVDARARGAGVTSIDSPSLQVALEESARSARARWHETQAPAAQIFVLPLVLPARVLLLGAGPDAAPVVEFAARLGWKVTVVDHRPAYAQAAHFPAADRVLLARPDQLNDLVTPADFSAAIVMSHHLPSDLAYLKALAERPPGYVGLLGPAARRERLFSELGALAETLRPRLRAPVGLPLGGRAPESIALAIVAEIHQFLHAH